jgi:hypothetical protein
MSCYGRLSNKQEANYQDTTYCKRWFTASHYKMCSTVLVVDVLKIRSSDALRRLQIFGWDGRSQCSVDGQLPVIGSARAFASASDLFLPAFYLFHFSPPFPRFPRVGAEEKRSWCGGRGREDKDRSEGSGANPSLSLSTGLIWSGQIPRRGSIMRERLLSTITSEHGVSGAHPIEACIDAT